MLAAQMLSTRPLVRNSHKGSEAQLFFHYSLPRLRALHDFLLNPIRQCKKPTHLLHPFLLSNEKINGKNMSVLRK